MMQKVLQRRQKEFPFEGVDATDDVLEASARTQDEGTKGEW